MNGIDLLEYGGGGFMIRRGGELISLPDPRTKHYQWVLLCLNLGYVPGIPDDVQPWQIPIIFERWAAAWDLPPFADARRLAYAVDHFRSELAFDLMTHVNGLDLGALWRERRWRTLLDAIDHLPGHAWYPAAMAQDDEYAKMVAEAMAARPDDEESEGKGPKLTTWSPEMAMLTNLTDGVRRLEWAVFASQAGKKAGEPPAPLPRPTTAIERAMKLADFNRRKSKHESLVARVLPKKRSE